MKKEMVLTEMDPDTSSNTSREGKHSAFSCPDCGGELLRFRCRVGHAFSARGVLEAQSEQVSLANQLAKRAHVRGQERAACITYSADLAEG